MTELRFVACHMGSHSVTCHPIQVNTPELSMGWVDPRVGLGW